jgi:hypothetical protein
MCDLIAVQVILPCTLDTGEDYGALGRGYHECTHGIISQKRTSEGSQVWRTGR